MAAGFWLAVWEAASLAVDLELLLPSPIRVAERLASLAGQADFWASAGGSMARIFLGFTAALLLGTAGAALSFRLTAAEALLRPVLRIVKATPVASFIILALVWIPSPGVPVFTSFLMVFPIVFENVLSGMRHTDRQLLEMGRMFRLSRAACSARSMRPPSRRIFPPPAPPAWAWPGRPAWPPRCWPTHGFRWAGKSMRRRFTWRRLIFLPGRPSSSP